MGNKLTKEDKILLTVKLSELIDNLLLSTSEGFGAKNKPPFDPIGKVKIERFKSVLSIIVTVAHLPKNRVWPCIDLYMNKSCTKARIVSVWGFDFITVGHKDCEFLRWLFDSRLLDDSDRKSIDIDIELPPSVERLTKRAVEEDE